MSTGMRICSACNREVHQDGSPLCAKGWRHCADGTTLCYGASAVYPRFAGDVIGQYCGKDGPLPRAWDPNDLETD